MSLHTLANHLQNAGRGDDKVLVHMTPGEVNGLQSLAMAHGGSLTTNPQTGLPEASFLRNLLPTLIGFGLAPITGGLSAALITGAGYTAATGSLKKGIMAGLGAYGGAGLAGGLNAMGATAGAKAGATAGASGANAAQTAITNYADDAANFAGAGANPFSANPAFNPAASKSIMFNTPGTTPGMTPSALTQTPLYPNVNFATGMNPPAKMFNAADIAARNSQIAAQTPVNMADPNAFVTTSVPEVTTNVYKQGLLNPANPATQPWDVASKMPRMSAYAQPERLAQYKDVNFASGATYTPPPPTSVAAATPAPAPAPSAYSKYMSQVGEGAKKVYAGGIDGAKALYDAMPSYSLAAGIAGPAMSYADEKREKMEEEMRRRAGQSPGMIRPYEFNYGATNVASQPYTGSAERLYFQPTFTALTPYEAPGPEYKKAGGGLAALAAGGAVDNPRALLTQAQQELSSKDPVQQMSQMNALGSSTGYPMASISTPSYNISRATPTPTNVLDPMGDTDVDPYTGAERFAGGGITPTAQQGEGEFRLFGKLLPREKSSGYEYAYDPNTMQFSQTGSPGAGAVTGGMKQPASPAQSLVPNINIPAYQTPEQQLGLSGFYDYANQQLSGYAAGGGISHLGDYSDGGRLLKGPGDGVSDSIPASIGNRQPARLADGEFVVPARIVSEIGNGSTEAGARKLYAMMDRVQKARRKTVGKNQVARNTKAEKLLPA